jgi:hypothetical protein
MMELIHGRLRQENGYIISRRITNCLSCIKRRVMESPRPGNNLYGMSGTKACAEHANAGLPPFESSRLI